MTMPSVSLRWTGRTFDVGGRAAETRAVVAGLDTVGVDVTLAPIGAERPAAAVGCLERLELLARHPPTAPYVNVIQADGDRMRRDPRATLSVGRLTLAAAGVSAGCSAGLASLDEVWVASPLDATRLADAGVAASKVHVVPPALDVQRLAVGRRPLPFAGVEGFVFLSFVPWTARKGWQTLIRAFRHEFADHEPVTLVIKTTADPDVFERRRAAYEAYVRGELGLEPTPRIRFIARPLSDDAIARLYYSVSAYIRAGRGIGWSRSCAEAMAVGLPTVAPRVGASLDFMSDENSFLVDCDLGDVPRTAVAEEPWLAGLEWGDPSEVGLREAMRYVFEDRAEAQLRGLRARDEMMERYGLERTVSAIRERLRAAGLRPVIRPVRPVRRVDVDAAVFADAELAEFVRALHGSGRVRLQVRDRPSDSDRRVPGRAALATLADGRQALPPEVTIRRATEGALAPPPAGRLVVVGPLPPMRDRTRVVDEVWPVLPHLDTALGRIDTLATAPRRRPSRRKELSVCLIVKNEGGTLPRALGSVRAVADEIVVVDTGSVDRTSEVARELGARVSSFEWCHDFAAARNASIRLATKDWILALDADHELDAGSVDELRALLQTDAFRGYYLQYCAVGSGRSLHNLDLRLFPNHPSVRFEMAVHERIGCTRADLEFERVNSTVLVHHHGERHSPGKAARYAEILERILAEDPDDGISAGYLGSSYALLGERRRSERAYRRAIEIAEQEAARVGGFRGYAPTAFAQFAAVLREDARWEEAAACARRSVELSPTFFDGWIALGKAELGRGRYPAALEAFVRAAAAPHGAVPQLPRTDASWEAHLGIADAFLGLDRPDGAREALERAVAVAPGSGTVAEARRRFDALRAARPATSRTLLLALMEERELVEVDGLVAGAAATGPAAQDGL